MANTKINQLPLYTGNTKGTYLVLNNSGETSTYKVTKETLFGNINSINTGSTNSLAYYQTTGSIIGNNVVQLVNNAATLALGTSAFNNSEPERLMVDGGASYNIATFQTSKQDSYAEVNIKNFGSGSYASTDLILWNDASTESSSFVDLGINSSNYSGGAIGYGGDGYLFSAANDMYIGSSTTGVHGHVHIFGGNMWMSSSISVYNDGTVGFGTDIFNNDANSIPSTGFTYEFSGSVKLDNDLKVDGFVETSHVQGTGSLYLQPNILDGRNIEIYNTGGNDIHIKGNVTNTFFGDDSNYLKIDNTAETITVNTNSGTTLNGFVILSEVSGSLNFADDAAAATGGVPLGGLYRNANFVMIRMT
jgi:hypothetical protein